MSPDAAVYVAMVVLALAAATMLVTTISAFLFFRSWYRTWTVMDNLISVLFDLISRMRKDRPS